MGGHKISNVLKVRGVTVPTEFRVMNFRAQSNRQPPQSVISDGLIQWGSCYMQED